MYNEVLQRITNLTPKQTPTNIIFLFAYLRRVKNTALQYDGFIYQNQEFKLTEGVIITTTSLSKLHIILIPKINFGTRINYLRKYLKCFHLREKKELTFVMPDGSRFTRNIMLRIT